MPKRSRQNTVVAKGSAFQYLAGTYLSEHCIRLESVAYCRHW